MPSRDLCVSSDRLPQKMQSHTGCIFLLFCTVVSLQTSLDPQQQARVAECEAGYQGDIKCSPYKQPEGRRPSVNSPLNANLSQRRERQGQCCFENYLQARMISRGKFLLLFQGQFTSPIWRNFRKSSKRGVI